MSSSVPGIFGAARGRPALAKSRPAPQGHPAAGPVQRYANIAFWQKMPGSAAFKIVPKTPDAEAQGETMPEPKQKTV
jgi:hypothetical protein